LGDATSEVVSYLDGPGGGWYDDDTFFPYNDYVWFSRGQSFGGGSSGGIFAFVGVYGDDMDCQYGSRAALVGSMR